METPGGDWIMRAQRIYQDFALAFSQLPSSYIPHWKSQGGAHCIGTEDRVYYRAQLG